MFDAQSSFVVVKTLVVKTLVVKSLLLFDAQSSFVPVSAFSSLFSLCFWPQREREGERERGREGKN